jgi:hypothetical protein
MQANLRVGKTFTQEVSAMASNGKRKQCNKLIIQILIPYVIQKYFYTVKPLTQGPSKGNRMQGNLRVNKTFTQEVAAMPFKWQTKTMQEVAHNS